MLCGTLRSPAVPVRIRRAKRHGTMRCRPGVHRPGQFVENALPSPHPESRFGVEQGGKPYRGVCQIDARVVEQPHRSLFENIPQPFAVQYGNRRRFGSDQVFLFQFHEYGLQRAARGVEIFGDFADVGYRYRAGFFGSVFQQVSGDFLFQRPERQEKDFFDQTLARFEMMSIKFDIISTLACINSKI